MQGFLAFTERLTAKAQGEPRRVFQESQEVIREELRWFERLGADRGLDVRTNSLIPRLPHLQVL